MFFDLAEGILGEFAERAATCITEWSGMHSVRDKRQDNQAHWQNVLSDPQRHAAKKKQRKEYRQANLAAVRKYQRDYHRAYRLKRKEAA